MHFVIFTKHFATMAPIWKVMKLHWENNSITSNNSSLKHRILENSNEITFYMIHFCALPCTIVSTVAGDTCITIFYLQYSPLFWFIAIGSYLVFSLLCESLGNLKNAVPCPDYSFNFSITFANQSDEKHYKHHIKAGPTPLSVGNVCTAAFPAQATMCLLPT